ncbi:succinylglutamate desuccinylase/aspartoacylase family protein [Aquamicrobium sp. LC103]|uniref:succinylglutamate desuccinylase/aspartoacylase domain-containing protein n=1 Tax=Aquamicrobium sp. LC103 TaxID=1120658 RepID=UPI00063E7DAD|nr:succinylglutamate desuccinylase/aspartoacylase family protein [Aquamicrobium sp. LC103]TKT78322.1 N-alpha-acetyl diaminobutyric acid deacetylase DoeB [Aquamicrobium sp. LC103]
MTVRPVPGSRGHLTIDPQASGKSSGHLVFPWSRDESAWGSYSTPVGVVSNGEGPTVLLAGGNHGDELEGPLAIRQVFAELDPKDVHGTAIFMPSLNHAAVVAGRRTSPIDGGNMNRAFLQRADGTLTEQVAHFVEACFVERADAVLDIHSGGRTMMFSPFAATHRLPKPADQRRAIEAVSLFGAPYAMVLEELDMVGMLDTAVESRGKLFVTTELGGGGSTTPSLVRMAVRGIRNFLAFTGILPRDRFVPVEPPRMLANLDKGYLSAPAGGLIQYQIELGQEVREGDLIATLHDLDVLDMPGRPITSPCEGLFIGRLHGGVTVRGDFIGLVARDLDQSSYQA